MSTQSDPSTKLKKIRDQYAQWDSVIPFGYGAETPGCNVSVPWYSTDSAQCFADNKCAKKDLGTYTSTSIEYSFNSLGYRSPEFNISTSDLKILVCGCSQTLGVGLNVSDCWPGVVQSVMSNAIATTIFNLASVGASTDYVSRTVSQSISIVKPDVVLVLWPELSRREVILDSYPYVRAGGTWNADKFKIPLGETNCQYQFQKNRMLVQSQCDLHSAEFYEYTVNEAYLHCNSDLVGVPARDLQHLGVNSQLHVAYHFLNQIDQSALYRKISKRSLHSV
jgi:hypothetical protein